ncbi:dTMP kinase [Candidatus Calescamantes bacterium]|nr:dTMP kinase [Candidatus Calescamantes bacterium]
MGKTKRKGYLLSIEGTEGTGKTTIAFMVKNYLEEKGYPVSLYREPGSTPVSEKIRQILLKQELDSLTEAFLYLASRRELIKKRIIPDLEKGKVVILDRYIDSTIAYQGYGRGLDIKWLEELNYKVVEGILPNLTLILLSSSPLGFLKEGKDRMEREPKDFHARVREGYHRIACSFPERVRIIEVETGIEKVFEKVKEIIEREVIPCLSRI